MKPILLDLPMPIVTPRLLIRPPQIGDGVVVNEAVLESLESLQQFTDWAHPTPTPDDTESFVREAVANWILKRNDEPYLPLFIFDKTSGRYIGGTGYHHFNWSVPCLETGYWIRKSASGYGFMTEAINALTHYAFKELHVKSIRITCEVDNVRSLKIPERLNYSLEGILRSQRIQPLTGKITDTRVYAKYDLDNLPELSVHWGTST